MYWAMETIMVEAAADGDASPGKPWRRCDRLRRRGATPHRERQRTDMSNVAVVLGERLARYGFGDGHPFGPDRHGAFVREFEARGLDKRVRVLEPRTASEEELRAFHSPAYLEFVRERSESGQGFLDAGDTPAFCGVAIELLKRRGLKRIGYVDIDAHHGDGVFYAFEEDPAVVFADLHEDGRYLYPGTGARQESGRGAAEGTKLNLPLPPGADDEVFAQVWPQVVAHLEKFSPEFIILQCGADSIEGDPITHLRFSPRVHGRAARELAALAERLGHGRVLALGGGGYHRENLARAWTAVVENLL